MTLLTYTMLCGEMEYLKTKTRLKDERFESVMLYGVVYNLRLVKCLLSEVKAVYYESIKRELKTKLIYECRCDERLKNEIEESIRLACTVLHDKTN